MTPNGSLYDNASATTFDAELMIPFNYTVLGRIRIFHRV